MNQPAPDTFTPPPITGYRNLTRAEVDAVNRVKAAERDLATIWGAVERDAAADPRWTAIARTHFEQAFMALNRAIMKPASPFATEWADIQQDEAEQVIPRRSNPIEQHRRELQDALNMPAVRDWDDIINAVRCLAKQEKTT